MFREIKSKLPFDVHDHNPESTAVIGPFASRTEAERYISDLNLRYMVRKSVEQRESLGRSLNHVTAFDERNHFRGWGRTFNDARASVRIRAKQLSVEARTPEPSALPKP